MARLYDQLFHQSNFCAIEMFTAVHKCLIHELNMMLRFSDLPCDVRCTISPTIKYLPLMQLCWANTQAEERELKLRDLHSDEVLVPGILNIQYK